MTKLLLLTRGIKPYHLYVIPLRATGGRARGGVARSYRSAGCKSENQPDIHPEPPIFAERRKTTGSVPHSTKQAP